MKQSILKFIFLYISTSLFSQDVVFEKREIYIGDVDINTTASTVFNVKNQSDRAVKLSYEPITNLVNASFQPIELAAQSQGRVTVNFYPESEGQFYEKLNIKVNGKGNIEISVYGNVSNKSNRMKPIGGDDRLFGDRDITFMAVDAITLKGVPFSKLFIENVFNKKRYIGVSDQYGILINKIPEGRYQIQSLVDGYKTEILDTRLDPNRNIAMVLLERDALLDTFKKLSSYRLKKKDTIGLIEKPERIENEPEPQAESPIVKVEKLKVDGTRKPLNIILLIDVSKSMEKPNRIGLLKKSMVNLVQNYEENDRLAILTFNDQVNTLLERTKIQNKLSIIQLINSILPSGSTDGVLGIDRAFSILEGNYMEDAINMVILASDGKITESSYDDKRLLEKVEQMNEKGILTSVIGFGTSGYEQGKLNKMASVGGGIYINMVVDVENVESILLDEIYSTLLKLKR